jgi:hypothetical protein
MGCSLVAGPINGFPPCLRRSAYPPYKYFGRRGFAQGGLKLRPLTACSVSQRMWFLFNYDTVSWGEAKGAVDRRFALRHFFWDEVEILRVSILQFSQWENVTLFFSMSPS